MLCCRWADRFRSAHSGVWWKNILYSGCGYTLALWENFPSWRREMIRVYLMNACGLEQADVYKDALGLVDSERRERLVARSGKPAALSLAAGLLIQLAYLDWNRENNAEKEYVG